jgi:hypothetical protein
MEVNILLNDGERYGGKYVALRSFSEKDVISSGSDPREVSAEAKRSGAEDPVLFYVPERGMVHIY